MTKTWFIGDDGRQRDMGGWNMTGSRSERIFKYINLFFWFIWASMPFCIYHSLDYWNVPFIFVGPEHACAPDFPKTFSEAGRLIAGSVFCTDIIFSLLFLGVMHRLVMASARGEFFITQTLRTMGHLAILLISWPIVIIAVFNCAKYALFRIGDLPAFIPSYQPDFIQIGAGLLVVVLKLILAHALELHEESKLTV